MTADDKDYNPYLPGEDLRDSQKTEHRWASGYQVGDAKPVILYIWDRTEEDAKVRAALAVAEDYKRLPAARRIKADKGRQG